jgi:two-component system, chemotaxis family, protein-glutamate methylesterase/glutaminase
MEDALVIENRIALEDKALTSGLLDLGTPSLYTCPECHGVLLQLPADPLVRFRCHTGHAYTLASLLAEISESMEQTLWNTVRMLEEQVLLLGQMAQSGEDPDLAASLAEKMQLAAQQIDLIRQMALQHALPH